MEQQELNDYRDQLLSTLEEDTPAGPRGTSPSFFPDIYQSRMRGFSRLHEVDSNYSFSSRDRSVHTVELRNEAGVLVGGLCAPEAGLKNLRVPIRPGWVDIHIHNRIDGGSVRMHFENNRPWWRRLSGAAA